MARVWAPYFCVPLGGDGQSHCRVLWEQCSDVKGQGGGWAAAILPAGRLCSLLQWGMANSPPWMETIASDVTEHWPLTSGLTSEQVVEQAAKIYNGSLGVQTASQPAPYQMGRIRVLCLTWRECCDRRDNQAQQCLFWVERMGRSCCLLWLWGAAGLL